MNAGILTYAYGTPSQADESVIKGMMISLEARPYITYRVLGLSRSHMSEEDVAAEAVHDADGRIVRQAVEVRLELVARHDARRVVGELAVDVHDLAGGLALERERHLHVALVSLSMIVDACAAAAAVFA